MNKQIIYLIDPPEGWRYGFPKAISEEKYKELSKNNSFKEYCIEQGYSKQRAEELKNCFHIGITGPIYK